MSWDGIRRRDTDNGREAPEAIWARIDERVNTLIENAMEVKNDLILHKEDDLKQFKVINRTIYMVSGGACVLIFLINFLKN